LRRLEDEDGAEVSRCKEVVYDGVLEYTIKPHSTPHEHMLASNAVTKDALRGVLYGVVRICTMITMHL